MVAGLWCVNVFGIIASVLSLTKGEEVEFLSKPSVLTVKEGGTAIFPCKVVNLGKSHRVAWISITSAKLLSIDGHTLSSNNHVIVTINPIGGFQLHIHKVTSRDAGEYKCMVSSDPVIEQTSILHVTDGRYHRRKKNPKKTRDTAKVSSAVGAKRRDLKNVIPKGPPKSISSAQKNQNDI